MAGLAPPHPSVTFPRLLLASEDENCPSFAGWVGSDASGEDLWLRLEPQTSVNANGGENANLRSSHLLLSPSLQRALRGHEDAVAARLRQSRDASEFFSELKTLLEAVGVVRGSGSGGGGRKKRRRRSRGGDCDGDDTDDAGGGGSGSGRALLPSSFSSSPRPRSAFYSALLERLGPRAWSSMTAMREAASSAAAAAAGASEGDALLSFSFAVRSEEAAAAAAGRRAPSPASPLPLRVTLALDPATFPRSAPRVASVDLPRALLRPPLALPIVSWWRAGERGGGGGGDWSTSSKSDPTTKMTTAAAAEAEAAAGATAAGPGSKARASTVDDVLTWLSAAASSRAAAAAFAALDQLDAAAWVLDPPLPAPRARTSRRLAAAGGGRASVEVDFATFFSAACSSSSAAPAARFFPAPRFSGWLGPDALVAPLREAAEASSGSRGGERLRGCWDASRAAVENLEALLSLEGEGRQRQQQQQQQWRLPRKPGGAAAETGAEGRGGGGGEGEPVVGLGDGAECAICCAYRLDGDDGDGGGGEDGGGGAERGGAGTARASTSDASSLPGVSCENERCGRPFHASCLREWLIAAAGDGGLGGGRGGGAGAGDGGGGGVLRGECPYCSEPISVKT